MQSGENNKNEGRTLKGFNVKNNKIEERCKKKQRHRNVEQRTESTRVRRNDDAMKN